MSARGYALRMSRAFLPFFSIPAANVLIICQFGTALAPYTRAQRFSPRGEGMYADVRSRSALRNSFLKRGVVPSVLMRRPIETTLLLLFHISSRYVSRLRNRRRRRLCNLAYAFFYLYAIFHLSSYRGIRLSDTN